MNDPVYYLQRSDNSNIWEQVDQFTYDNLDKAVLQDGNARFSGNRCRKDATGITIDCKNLTARESAMLMRILGVKEQDCPSSIPGGFVRKLEFVKIRKPSKSCKDRVILHEINGCDFSQSPSVVKITEIK